MGKGPIFVSIAAFCDPFLRFTIESLFAEARQPEALVLGVVDQSMESLAVWLGEQPFVDQVRYLHIDPLHSRGVCWARHLAQSLYDDEAYFLQVDSHTWFAPGWDETLFGHMNRLRKVSNKPVLSIYPPGFEFDDGGRPVRRSAPNQSVAVFEVKPNQVLTPDNLVLTFKAAFHNIPADGRDGQGGSGFYALGFHLAGGFIFAPGEFIQEVPYDPRFYFHGEEQGLALRAFTRGWDLFHPQFHQIPLFHLYKMPASASLNLHWREDLEARRRIKWPERRRRAQHRLSELLAGHLEAPYGLGCERSLDAFTVRSGIDYSALCIESPELILVEAPSE
ncbi:MAG: GlcNAc-transferase family protein [Haliea sp.]